MIRWHLERNVMLRVVVVCLCVCFRDKTRAHWCVDVLMGVVQEKGDVDDVFVNVKF